MKNTIRYEAKRIPYFQLRKVDRINPIPDVIANAPHGTPLAWT